ncbi:MAG: four helix bundle protein [Cyanobacteria bacterium J06638_20]
MPNTTRSLQNLQVYQLALRCSVEVYDLAQQFPEGEDRYLVRRMLATSRAVRAQIAIAWGQRRKGEVLLRQLIAAQSAAAEMQTWIEAAICLGYISPASGQDLYDRYRYLDTVLDQLMETAAVGATQLENSVEVTLPATA